jgi:hypothetical protein
MGKNILLMLGAMLLTNFTIAKEEIRMVHDFEDASEVKAWEFSKVPELSSEHVTHGARSLKLVDGEYMRTFRNQDWSGFDSMLVDIFVDGEANVAVILMVGDKEWNAKPTYWNRHNGFHKLKPGANTFCIPVGGLFRGEAGSRAADLKTNINPREITRFDMGFNVQGKGKLNSIHVDNMRLVKEVRPDGILAFDFGTPNQSVFPGFSPVSWNTVYGQDGNKYGLKSICPGINRARDDTFPTRLFQDWVWFEENGNEFIIDMPNGKYHVSVVFNDCGYWHGETCQHRTRSILTNGKVSWSEDRGSDGPKDFQHRFENIEPHPGDSIWVLYIKELFKPATFEVQVTDGKLRLGTKADALWSTKVASVIIYPESIKTDAERWLAKIEERNQQEFDARAVCLGPKKQDLQIPPEAKEKGWWLGFPAIDEQISLLDAPGKLDAKLLRVGAQGQRLSFTFAIHPLNDFGEVKSVATDLTGPVGKLPAAAVELRYVNHLLKRSFNEVSYNIVPMTLRKLDGSGLKLPKDLTRQFWVTVAIPSDAKAGLYSGEVKLTAGKLSLSVPLSVQVIDVPLVDPEFTFGFLGTGDISDDRLRQALIMMKENGMNSFSGGRPIEFSGLDDAGKPKLDFSACDAFYKLVKECGYSKPVYAYGNPHIKGLHSGPTIGATGREWEKKTGKSFKELLKIVWTAVQEHAEKENWPKINWGIIDEPRTPEATLEQLELLKCYRDAVPFVRTGGYYTVVWQHHDIMHTAIQDMFKTMTWSALNVWTNTDLEKSKELGREVHLYNQGTSRYSFGAYQWAAYHKGVKGRMQWLFVCIYGYQFFDLDAREPDEGIAYLGRKEIIPSINLPRCSEGASDFRFAYTLWKMAEKRAGTPEARAAREFLEDVSRKISPGQRTPPAGFMTDEAFRSACIEHIAKLQQAK